MTEQELRQQMAQAVIQLLGHKVAQAHWTEDVFDQLAQDFVKIALAYGYSRYDEGVDIWGNP